MHGNVWEWCEDDSHNNYVDAPEDGTAWVSSPSSSQKVLRGGSWVDKASVCRSANRYLRVDRQKKSDNYGFRVVLPQIKIFPEYIGNGIALDMVSIPDGNFLMGSPEAEGFSDEKPQHKVTVQPFYMGKSQVTQAQWQEIMGNNPACFQHNPLNPPVEQVSWEDAQEFCDRLSQKTEKEYRLPSEAEWEYACRAVTTTAFHFGETITADLANYNASYTYADEPTG